MPEDAFLETVSVMWREINFMDVRTGMPQECQVFDAWESILQ